MSTALDVAPQSTALDSSVNDCLIHVVCCHDFNLGACGTSLVGQTEKPGTNATCVVCADLGDDWCPDDACICPCCKTGGAA